jgi:hypothetical protein
MSDATCSIERLGIQGGARIDWCPDCGAVHLSLGFVQLKLSTEQFQQLHQLMKVAIGQLGDGQRSQAHPQSDPGRGQIKRDLH